MSGETLSIEQPQGQLSATAFNEFGCLKLEGNQISTGGTARVIEIAGKSESLAAKTCLISGEGLIQSGMNLVAAELRAFGIEVERHIDPETGLDETEGAWYLDAATVMDYLRGQPERHKEVASPMQVYENLYAEWRKLNSGNAEKGLQKGDWVFQLFIREFFVNLELQWMFEQVYGNDQESNGVATYPAPYVKGLGFTNTIEVGELIYAPVIVMDRVDGIGLNHHGVTPESDECGQLVAHYGKVFNELGMDHGDLKPQNIMRISGYDPDNGDDPTEWHKVIDLGSATIR